MPPETPVRASGLKVIDHMGTYYAHTAGGRAWKIEKWLQRLLMMCDGRRTTEDIAAEIAKMSGSPLEDVRVGLRPILEDLKRSGMIEMR